VKGHEGLTQEAWSVRTWFFLKSEADVKKTREYKMVSVSLKDRIHRILEIFLPNQTPRFFAKGSMYSWMTPADGSSCLVSCWGPITIISVVLEFSCGKTYC